ncbi:hypothetical protein [Haematomicrobium sanguinis]|uniref:hypothetical protein n=1 Tax=Haematomicrobium sanguinis TaxID=479106 RepID=UPI00047B3397|nr:hypothetical protein [Haematomicrobium sanguinis]
MSKSPSGSAASDKLTQAVAALAGVAEVYPPHGAIRAEAERLWKVLGGEDPETTRKAGFVEVTDSKATARISVTADASAPDVAKNVAALLAKHHPDAEISVTVVRIQGD